MIARRTESLEIVFAPEARAALERLPEETRVRVVAACESLAELAGVAPLPVTPVAMPALNASVEGLALAYDVLPEVQTFLVRRIG